jgi:hypothetical protein
MATGPDHYREAERRLLMAWEENRTLEDTAHLVAEAQVHATLALAAATALIDETPRSDAFGNYRSWQTVAGIDGSDS